MDTQDEIPSNQAKQELLAEMMKIMHSIFDFMTKYAEAKKKYPDFFIDFIERNI